MIYNADDKKSVDIDLIIHLLIKEIKIIWKLSDK
jgi:hypothetical protein